MRDRINKCYKERGGTLTTATTIIVLFSSLSRRIKKTEIKKSFQKNQQQQQKKNSINRTDRPKARTVRRLEWRPMIDRVFDCATTTSTSILVPLFLVFFCLFFFWSGRTGTWVLLGPPPNTLKDNNIEDHLSCPTKSPSVPIA